MLNFLIYITEVSITSSIFYLFYRYLYFKLSYFTWSRYFFYGFLILSLTIPLLPGFFSQKNISENISYILINGNGIINIKDSFLHKENHILNESLIIKVMFIIWVSGTLRYIFIILKDIFSVIFLVTKNNKKRDENFVLISADFPGNVFSFFNFIFLNKNFENLSINEQQQILKHEKIHAKQLHSADNLIFEIFRAFCWFNPVSKYIVADIKIIHEFIVDNIITENKNKPDYSKLILKLSAEKNGLSAVSNFSKEEIKNRIKLISIPENENIRKRRFIISLPVLIITVFAAWIIISSLNGYIINNPETNKIYRKPFADKSYKIISPYYENKKINNLVVSHRETSYEVKSFSKIYSIYDGTITATSENKIFDLSEYTITQKLKTGDTVYYKGIYKPTAARNKKVKKGQIIGITGDIRLYPKIDIRIARNGKTVNPEMLY